MISASLSLVSQALAQGVNTKQECMQGARGAKGNRQEAPDGSQCLSVCTHKCTQVHLPILSSGGIQTFRQDTHRPLDKTHKHNDNKKTQKQPVPTMKQMYKTAFCAAAVVVAVDATKI